MIIIEYFMKFFGYVKTQKAVDRITIFSSENARKERDIVRLVKKIKELGGQPNKLISKESSDLSNYRSEVTEGDLKKKIKYLNGVIDMYKEEVSQLREIIRNA